MSSSADRRQVADRHASVYMWVKIDVCKAADRRQVVYMWVKIDVCKAADRRKVVYMWVKDRCVQSCR